MAIEGLHSDQTVPISLDEKIAGVRRKLTDPDATLKDLLELAKLLERGNDPTLSLALHDHIGDQMPESIKKSLGRACQERRLSDVLLAIAVRMDYTAKGIADAISDIIREQITVAGYMTPSSRLTDEATRRNVASFLGEVAVEALSRTMDHLNVMTAFEDGLHMSAKPEAMRIFAVEVRAAMIDQARANANEHDEVVEAVRDAMVGDPPEVRDFPDYGYGDAAGLGQGPPWQRPQVSPRPRYASMLELGRPTDTGMLRRSINTEGARTGRTQSRTPNVAAIASQTVNCRNALPDEPRLSPTNNELAEAIVVGRTNRRDISLPQRGERVAGEPTHGEVMDFARQYAGLDPVARRVADSFTDGEVDNVSLEIMHDERRREVTFYKGEHESTAFLDDGATDEAALATINEALMNLGIMVEADRP